MQTRALFLIMILSGLAAVSCIEMQEMAEIPPDKQKIFSFVLHVDKIKTYPAGSFGELDVAMEELITDKRLSDDVSQIEFHVRYFRKSQTGDICGRGGEGIFFGETVTFTDGADNNAQTGREICGLGVAEKSLERGKVGIGAFMKKIVFDASYDFGEGQAPVNCVFHATEYACISDEEKGGQGCFAQWYEGVCQVKDRQKEDDEANAP